MRRGRESENLMRKSRLSLSQLKSTSEKGTWQGVEGDSLSTDQGDPAGAGRTVTDTRPEHKTLTWGRKQQSRRCDRQAQVTDLPPCSLWRGGEDTKNMGDKMKHAEMRKCECEIWKC